MNVRKKLTHFFNIQDPTTCELRITKPGNFLRLDSKVLFFSRQLEMSKMKWKALKGLKNGFYSWCQRCSCYLETAKSKCAQILMKSSNYEFPLNETIPFKVLFYMSYYTNTQYKLQSVLLCPWSYEMNSLLAICGFFFKKRKNHEEQFLKSFVVFCSLELHEAAMKSKGSPFFYIELFP